MDGLSEESELTLRNESLIKAWLWGRWMPGMSKWIMPRNTWHQLFCLSGYCCWHKVMHSAGDPRWHRMISWDVQAFWSCGPSASSSAVSLQLRRSDSLCFLWNDAVWWGCFTEMDWARFFFDNNGFFFHVSGFLWVEKSLNPRAEHNTTKGICISCQFVIQSLLLHIMCHFPIRYINPLYFIPFLIFLMECHLEYRTGRVFFSSQDSSIALGRTASISWAATATKNLLISDHVISVKYLSSTV